MNQEWSALHKTMQAQIKREETCPDGIRTLLDLRSRLMQTLLAFRQNCSAADFSAMPFMHADGYHSKSIAYSLWHIFRIEDIVAHTLICGDEQVFFSGHFQARMNAPIITTGNELAAQEIADFSKRLDISALYEYIACVKDSTDTILRRMPFAMLKQKIPAERRENLQKLNVVSSSENAVWLIDYWCGKDIRGLIQMPFSRHWIMHTEASLRIANRIYKS